MSRAKKSRTSAADRSGPRQHTPGEKIKIFFRRVTGLIEPNDKGQQREAEIRCSRHTVGEGSRGKFQRVGWVDRAKDISKDSRGGMQERKRQHTSEENTRQSIRGAFSVPTLTYLSAVAKEALQAVRRTEKNIIEQGTRNYKAQKTNFYGSRGRHSRDKICPHYLSFNVGKFTPQLVI